MNKLAKLLNGKSFSDFIVLNDLKDIDVKDLVNLMGYLIKCNAHDFKFDKNGKIQCLENLFANSLYMHEIKQKIWESIDKLDKNQIKILLEWDKIILKEMFEGDNIVDGFTIIITPYFPKRAKKAVDMFKDEVADILIESINKSVKNLEKSSYAGVVEIDLSSKYTVNNVINISGKFICLYKDEKLTKTILDFITKNCKYYIKRDKLCIVRKLDNNCLLESIFENNIEVNDIFVKYILSLYASKKFNIKKELIGELLNKICNNYKYEHLWDWIKNKVEDEFNTSSYLCFDVTELFNI
jgi:hypothetical protein